MLRLLPGNMRHALAGMFGPDTTPFTSPACPCVSLSPQSNVWLGSRGEEHVLADGVPAGKRSSRRLRRQGLLGRLEVGDQSLDRFVPRALDFSGSTANRPRAALAVSFAI